MNRNSALLSLFVVLAVLLTILFAEPSGAATVTVAWDPNPEPTVAGYRLYYGTSSRYYTNSVDVSNSTRCTISALVEGVTYYMAVTAYDTSGNQSGYSNEIVYTVPGGSTPAPSPDSGAVSGGGGGGGCFIATAAFGSPLEPEVILLREFRDTCLLTNGPGRAFVDFYYRVSPPIAEFISRDEDLRQITRGILWPLVLAVKNPTAAVAMIISALSLGILCCTGRRRGPERQITLPAARRNLLFRKQD
ncbi:MAG: fibronectin type III domain-containing protein [Syntrophobacterales bacterium]|nr:fibronectin type III domain-containing protein [Syntrophobacterales bacterium]